MAESDVYRMIFALEALAFVIGFAMAYAAARCINSNNTMIERSSQRGRFLAYLLGGAIVLTTIDGLAFMLRLQTILGPSLIVPVISYIVDC